MRPLRVAMQAFGPYAGEQTLDFADLRGAGFFLITGPTGSGKTTVLDAMSFALYGVTSGGPESEGGRSGASMRSDHADPQLLTRVVFDFALGEDLYRIQREPEQERPKLKGEGTTSHHQSATLWRLSDSGGGPPAEEGGPLATGWMKVSAKSEELLGFRSEQFRQVVMLPQGRFQKLLEADSKEREQILRALFDTGHYTAIELALKDAAKGLRDQAARVAAQRAEALRQAEADSSDDLAERCAKLSVAAGEAAAHASTSESARDEAQERLQHGRDAAARLEELARAEQAATVVARREDEIDAARNELEAATRAATVVDVAEHALAARKEAASRGTTAAASEAERLRLSESSVKATAVLRDQEDRAVEREAAATEALRLRSLTGVTSDLAAARTAARQTAAAADSARRAAAGIEAAWTAAGDALTAAEAATREAQAGLLACDLRDGQPCPVCGSTEHPLPASLAEEAPAAGRLDELRLAAGEASDARDAANRELREAESAEAAAAARLAERERAAHEFTDPAELATAVAAAEARAAELDAALREATTLAHKAETAAATAATTAAAAAGELAKADAEASRARRELDTRLTAAGFPDEEAWTAARRRPGEMSGMRDLVIAHEQESLRAAERLRIARDAAEGVEPPDLGALEAEAAAAADLARDARTAAAELAAAAETAVRQLDRLGQLRREAEALDARYRVFGRLSDVANGDNARHLSFQRYVLGAFLDDVLVAASQRLHLMSKGRYRLERTERRFGGKAAAGLNLEVYDAWTGVARPVATLSGGETFMAALSLALGLAEVVQAHAGGIRLETVFVDEGFGSLDDESLDLAIGALMGLGEDGRLVGIISHVSELRERIDARLEVKAGKTGSLARFVVS